jgi:hypothetical protein
MRPLLRTILTSALAGAILGLPILGIGGRALMRVVAHWEGRVPVLTLGGTITVLFAGTMFGVAAGIVFGLLKRYVRNPIVMNVIFLIVCIAFTWRAVNELLPRPRLMFVALTLVFAAAMELFWKRRSSRVITGVPAS